jgi:hypothetical protein
MAKNEDRTADIPSEEEIERIKKEALKDIPEPLRPPDIDELKKGIRVVSPTERILDMPQRGEPVPGDAQRRLQAHRYKTLLGASGIAELQAQDNEQALLEGNWVVVEMQGWQTEQIEQETGWRIEELHYADPYHGVEVSMRSHNRGATHEMARQVAGVLSYYEAFIGNEKTRLLHGELERRFEAELKKTDKARDKHMKKLMPKIVDKKTGKRIV